MSDRMTESEIDELAERIADINSPAWRAEVKRILRETLCATTPKPATAKVVMYVATGEHRVAEVGEWFRWPCESLSFLRALGGSSIPVDIYRQVESDVTAFDFRHATYSPCPVEEHQGRCGNCDRVRKLAADMEGRA